MSNREKHSITIAGPPPEEMALSHEPSQESYLAKRIAGVNAKTCPVKEITKLLYDITGEEKWVDRDYYQAFAVRMLCNSI
jgi:hypothetical protein